MSLQKNLFRLILKDLKKSSNEQIYPVTVPMLIDNTWSKCFNEIYKLYKEAKYDNRIQRNCHYRYKYQG